MKETRFGPEFHALKRWAFHPSKAEQLLYALDQQCRSSGMKRHDCLVVVARLLGIILTRWGTERRVSPQLAELERVIALAIIEEAADEARPEAGALPVVADAEE